MTIRVGIIGAGFWGKSDRDPKLKFDVDDFATGLIKFENGMTLELNVSWVLHRYENRQANRLDTILGKDRPICTIEQALVVQKILDGIYASSARGREVRIR